MSDQFSITRPKRMVSGPNDLKKHWNEMVVAIDQLEKAIRARTLRGTPDMKISISPDGTRAVARRIAGSKSAAHPFRIYAQPIPVESGDPTELEVRIEWGNVYVPAIVTRSGDIIPAMESIETLMSDGLTGLVRNPAATAVGTEVIPIDTPHGIWLQISDGSTTASIADQEGTSGLGPAEDEPYDTLLLSPHGGSAVATSRIFLSTTHLEPSALSTLINDEAGTYVYLGKIDAEGKIKQHQRSDIVIPPWTLPTDLSEQGAHPWRVTKNDDGTLAVAPGKALKWETQDGGASGKNFVFNLKISSYPGGNHTASGAGYLYATVGVTAITVEFSTDDPQAYQADKPEQTFPIAQIDVSGNIDQILTHNPTWYPFDLVTVKICIPGSGGAAPTIEEWEIFGRKKT